MGLRFRKSKEIGPFRVNFSKSGVGYSYGNKYARVTHTADGKKRTTLNVPGTGLSYVEESGSGRNKPDAGQQQAGASVGSWVKFVVYMAIFLLLLYAFSGRGSAVGIDTVTVSEILETVVSEVETNQEPEETTIAVHIANKNTKKYHEYGCKAAPKESSKSYWLTEKTDKELEELGYSHCKNCIDFEEKTISGDLLHNSETETLEHAPSHYNDGFICFADKKTKIYHNTWCDYAPEFGTKNCYSGYKTADEIEEEGYKPCAKCIW